MTKVIDTTAMNNETLASFVQLLVQDMAIQSEKIDYLTKAVVATSKLCAHLVEMANEVEVTLYAPAGLAPKQ